MTLPTKLRTHLELDEIFSPIEEHLQPNEAAILIIASPKEGGGTNVSLCVNCSDVIVKASLTQILADYDEKLAIPAESAH